MDSGDLRKAIKSKGQGDAVRVLAMRDVGYEKEQFHGRFLELGTSQQAARPFLRPALEEAEQSGEIIDGFVTALNKTIARALGRL